MRRSATGLCIHRILNFPVASIKWAVPVPRLLEMIFGCLERLMKKLITFSSILITVAILALPVAARNSIAQPDNAVQDQCSQEAKDALYQSFLKNRPTDQAKAYDDAKKYL